MKSNYDLLTIYERGECLYSGEDDAPRIEDNYKGIKEAYQKMKDAGAITIEVVPLTYETGYNDDGEEVTCYGSVKVLFASGITKQNLMIITVTLVTLVYPMCTGLEYKDENTLVADYWY